MIRFVLDRIPTFKIKEEIESSGVVTKRECDLYLQRENVTYTFINFYAMSYSSSISAADKDC